MTVAGKIGMWTFALFVGFLISCIAFFILWQVAENLPRRFWFDGMTFFFTPVVVVPPAVVGVYIGAAIAPLKSDAAAKILFILTRWFCIAMVLFVVGVKVSDQFTSSRIRLPIFGRLGTDDLVAIALLILSVFAGGYLGRRLVLNRSGSATDVTKADVLDSGLE